MINFMFAKIDLSQTILISHIMESKINSISTLKDLLITELGELYSTNEQELNEMVAIENEAASKKLKTIIQKQLKRTQIQQNRLKEVFHMINTIPSAKKCLTTEGILKQTKEHIASSMESNVRDSSIISSLQKLNHRKITGFGSAAAYARELSKESAARILRETLAEEKEIDNELTELAESEINKMAKMMFIE